MNRMTRPLLLGTALSLGLTGCTTTNPKDAFDRLRETVGQRAGHEVRWMRSDADGHEIAKTVRQLLQTNLTAESAVAIALLNNRALQAEFEELGISQADLAQAARLRNPSFSGFWRLPTHSPTVVNAEQQVTQDFLDLLTLPARKKIAAQNLEQTRLLVAGDVLKTAAEAKSAFYTVQARQQLLGRLEAIMEVNEAGADLATRQRKAGNITALELANQAAVFQQSRLEAGRTSAQLSLDRERLNDVLGLWGPETEWKVAGELPPLPMQEIPLEHLETQAVQQRLDLAAARAQVQSIEASLRLKKSVRWLPAASLGVNAEHDLDHSWVVGPTLDLELPIFDQGQPAIARLAAQYRQAQRRLEASAIQIRAEVRRTRSTLMATRDFVEFYRKIYLPQRIRIVNETLIQYNAMQEGPLALVAAKERELSAEREYIEGWRDYWIARAELERVVGGKFSSSESSHAASPSNNPAIPQSTAPSGHEHEHDNQ